MPAPKGNKNAEKWTEAKAEEFVKSVLTILEKDKTIRTIEGACIKAGKYETALNYLVETFPDVVFEPYARVKAIAKERLASEALDNKVNAQVAIFLLKNNHGMADKVEQKTEHKTDEGGLIVKLGGQDIHF